MSSKTDTMLGFITPILGRMARNDAFSLPGDIGNQSRVLVIDSGDLTEILFFSPILKYLKQRYPGMRVTFLVREGNSELVRTMGEISEMITYEPNHLSLASTTFLTLIRRVRSRDFNVAFLLGSDFSFARSLLTLLTRARIRVGYTSDFTAPFLNCEIRVSNRNAYEGSKVRSFLTALGLNSMENLPGWALPDADLRWAKQLIHFHKPEKGVRLIAVDPGMGKERHRLVENAFAYLVENLDTRVPHRILVLSNNLDQKHLAHFRERLGSVVLDIEPKNAKEGLALLSSADLLLSGNTDYFHFGVTMRIPTVGLFTRHDTERWFPKNTPWVQIVQGVKGQTISVDEFNSKIDTLLHLARVE